MINKGEDVATIVTRNDHDAGPAMKFEKIKTLIRAKKFQEALDHLDELLAREKECPYLWNLRGDLIQLWDSKDGPPLHEAAEAYLKAIEINPNDLDALEELAHFYDAVDQKPIEAKKYARAYIEKAKPSLIAMEQILLEE